MAKVLGGWQLGVIWSGFSGGPLGVTSAVNNTFSQGGGQRSNWSGQSALQNRGPAEQRIAESGRHLQVTGAERWDPGTGRWKTVVQGVAVWPGGTRFARCVSLAKGRVRVFPGIEFTVPVKGLPRSPAAGERLRVWFELTCEGEGISGRLVSEPFTVVGPPAERE